MENLVLKENSNPMMEIDFTSVATSYCSMRAETAEEKQALFKAMNNPEFRVADFINKVIIVKDVYAEIVQIADKVTGEISHCPRIVLIDTEGKGYQCVSLGMYSGLKKLFQVFGNPTWENGLSIEIKQLKKGERSILTFNVV